MADPFDGNNDDITIADNNDNLLTNKRAQAVTGIKTFTADVLKVDSVIVHPYVIVTHKINPANASGEFCFVADRAYTVVGINEIHNVVAGQACALSVRKCTSAGTALADATAGATCVEILASTIDITATAGVTQAASLSAVAGAITLASGDKIGIKMGNGTSLVGGNLTIKLKAV